jgi:serine/threonine protein kinase
MTLQDLAARNVLVGANEICKVADFGLLREIPRDDAFYTASHNVPCPIRWMAPESISDRQFSAASDVWSFGVLVWEMFHPTKLPFENYDNLACVSKVRTELHTNSSAAEISSLNSTPFPFPYVHIYPFQRS